MSTPDDPYADRLRAALHAEADAITPGADALVRIRDRIQARSPLMRWARPLVAVTAVAVVAAGIAGGVAIARHDDDSTLQSQSGNVPPVLSPSGTATHNATPTTGPTTPAATMISVPVYYLHDTGTAIRLYREFHRVPMDGGPIRTAIEQLLSSPANDPDYTSIWPSGTRVLGIAVHGDLATVDLSFAATGGFNGGSEAAAQSIQQLVYTVTAADTAIKRVQIKVDGQHIDQLWGSVDTRNPIARGTSYLVLGAVWVLSPDESERLPTMVTVSGLATVFEGTVSIDLLRDGKLVKRTFATATQGAPGRGRWEHKFVLLPGHYVVRAYESSARNGQPTNVDTKSFTVV